MSDSRSDDNTREVQRYLPLHPLEARILLVLSTGEAHGYAIVKEIEARDAAWTKIFPANLYRRLRDLLAKGLIDEAQRTVDESGRPKRPFRITELGRAVARAESARVQELAAAFRASDLASDVRGDR
jgi:DNA-binding PadR family transcriptional regulator